VSEPVARLWPRDSRKTGASVGVELPGSQGRAGKLEPTWAKPIGLVYVGVSFGDAEGATTVTELHIPGDRERIRYWASQHALELVRRG